MKRVLSRTFLTLILFTALFALIRPERASAQEESYARRTVTVNGHGLVRAQPDMATVRFGVVTIDRDPEAARSRNARVSSETMNAVRGLGIDESSIKLDALRIEPYREYDADARRYIDKGFQATRLVSVRLKELDVLPALIAEIVQKGANRISGIVYSIQEREVYEREAIKSALENAKEKASLMVETLGASLGEVLQISEQGVLVPAPRVMYEMASAKADAPEPEAYAGGELEITATVTVVFEIR